MRIRQKSKFLKITVLAGAILVSGVVAYHQLNNKPIKNWENTEKEVTYEIGVNDNQEIRSSIIGGCSLNQYIRGVNAEEISNDSDGKSYCYEDDNGITYIYENNEGDIYSVTQECKYTSEVWRDVKSFWESLNNKEQNYIGSSDIDLDTIDWDSSDVEVELTGSSELYEYCFRKYKSFSYTLEDGRQEGFDGTAISIFITEIEGEENEQ